MSGRPSSPAAGQGPWNGQPRGSWGAIGRSIRPALRLLEVRLRVPAALVMAALVVGRWGVIRNHWDRLTRVRTAASAAMRPVSNDIEYFCPMDPGVVSRWPSKCGVCNMALVLRARGDAAMRPDGVVARMQLSPYRIQLAGILTAPVEFRPLACEYRAVGVVRRAGERSIAAWELPRDKGAWVHPGTTVPVRCRDLAGRESFSGTVLAVERPAEDLGRGVRVSVGIDDPRGELPPGAVVEGRLRVPAAELEPFRSRPADPPPLWVGEPRSVHACLDHVGSLAPGPGRCPLDRTPLSLVPLADHQRLRWGCPMHPDVVAETPGAVCEACAGMPLKPRIVSFRPHGQVLAVPESAVIDTGTRTVVFVETMPGLFDAVEVVLGPKCGQDYPVVSGLDAGQKIAITGAFLLDAETRLNPSLAAGYFGAARDQARTLTAPSGTPKVASATVHDPLAALAPEDREPARRQRLCPVTRKPLGSMGTPTRVVLEGRVIFLCCDGCDDPLRREPARYLAHLPKPGSP